MNATAIVGWSRRRRVTLAGAVVTAMLAGLLGWRLPTALELPDRREELATLQHQEVVFRASAEEDTAEATRLWKEARQAGARNDRLEAKADRAHQKVVSLKKQIDDLQDRLRG